MNTNMMLAPLALAMGLAAAPSHAHGAVTVAVPAIVVDVNGVQVTLRAPPPVVVVREPAPEVVVVHETVYREPVYQDVTYRDHRDVVVVHDRSRPTRVVYVEPARYESHEDDRKCGKHGKRGHGHDRGHDQGKYRR